MSTQQQNVQWEQNQYSTGTNGQPQDGQVHEANKEQHTSYVHTEVRMPQLPTPVFMSSSEGLAKELVGEGFHASISRISAGVQNMEIYDSPQLQAEAQRDYEAKMAEQEHLTKIFEKEIARRTELYRKEQEAESEKIRKELEKQHHRDVEFRKELVEAAIEQQKRQLDLESRYAKKELDRQRQMARQALEHSKFDQKIEVTLDSAAGQTHSHGETHSESEKVSRK
ncbi:CAHS4 [Ramazzottius varieornatus]|uniref:CAHS4 n=1 Tax=Ramazzottius varieornatus TaxID=947166 RepID=A0A1D1UP25_RAMVA|nr:CAHS4 [Ramazzottius varieornatus]